MNQRFSKLLFSCVMMSVTLTTGCAAIHPIHGIPVSQVPEEYLSISRSGKQTISHSLLTQPVPAQHIVDRGDVLGIYIEGVLGNPGESPPVNFPVTPDGNPSIGFPLQVRDDGTISMPLYGSVTVKGMTLRQIEDHLREYFTGKGIINKGREKIIVTLQKPRTVRVLVLRQEAPGAGASQLIQQGGGLNLGQLKQGTGKTVYLPAYQNDVLHALAETGGLPGLDAENAVYIIRNTNPNMLPQAFEQAVPAYFDQQGYPGVQGQPMMQGQPMVIPNGPVSTVPQQYGVPMQGYPAPQFVPGMNAPVQTPVHTYQPMAPGFSFKSPFAKDKSTDAGGLEVVLNGTKENKADWNLLKVNGPVEYVQARGWENQREYPTAWEQSVQQASYNNYPVQYAAQQRGVIPDAVQPVIPPALPPPVYDQRGSDMGATKSQLDKIDKMQIDLSKDPIYNIDRAPGNALPAPKFEERPRVDLNQFTPIRQNPQQPQLPVNSFSTNPSIQQNPATRYATGTPVMQGEVYNNSIQNPGMMNMPVQGMPQQVVMPHQGMMPPSNVSGYPTSVNNMPLQMNSPVPMQGGHQVSTLDPYNLPPNVTRIPIRLMPGEQVNVRPEDVILNDGDIIFIESRETEIYYTAGLLGGGQYTIPRDYDLDVIGAISIAQSSQNTQSGNSRAIGGVSAINGDVTISASDVVILRKTPDGKQIPIKVDLYKAINDPCERILIMPGDVVMLRYKCGEGIAAFIERNLLEGALFSVAAAQLQTGNNR